MSDDERRGRNLTAFDRLIEVIAVMLLGVTTFGTAWCAYQAAQWNDRSADLAGAASQQHIESARLFGLATQTISYDSFVIAQYATARSQGNDNLARFYRNSLVRPDFVPILDRWEATVRAGGTPTRLTEDPEYLSTQLGAYDAAVARAGASTAAGQAAGGTAAAYVATTILLAAALFFAGVTSSFRYRPARLILLTLAVGTVAVAASRLAELAVA